MCAQVLGKLLKPFIKLQSKKSLPITNGLLKIDGLSSLVEIIRDKWGVPHVYAKNNHDLFMAFGFVHAQDRFWQMEVNRRGAAGTLSEVLGKASLDTDRVIRTFGINRMANRDLNVCDSETKALLQAYTDGVNAWLSHPSTRLPVEFGLLKYQPAPWTLLDCVLFMELLLWILQGNWALEPVLGNIAAVVGEEAMAELDPDYTVNPGIVKGGFDVNIKGIDGKFKTLKGPYLKLGGGSNAWVIAGSKTVSGKPIHMNDPHLAPSTPAIWYLAHLVGGDFNMTGVSLPGVPFIAIGHNARCSWSCCISSVDGVDLFVEKLNPDNPHQYRYKDKWLDAEIIDEPIKIKGKAEPFIEKVVVTRHGPLISGIEGLGAHGANEALAYCSVARDPGHMLRGAVKVNKMASWDDFMGARNDLDLFYQHVAYADIDGNIGSHVCCRAPLRKKGHDGRTPVPGWTGEFDWGDKYITCDQMPHCLNPEKGFVVVANNKPFEGDGYPYYLGNVWDPGFRARRITSVIAGMEKKVTVEDLMPLHVDYTSESGKDLVAHLEGFQTADPEAALALNMIRSWNGVLSADSTGGTVCELAIDFMIERVFEATIKTPSLVERAMGKGFHPLLNGIHEYFGSIPLILFRLLEKPESSWIRNAGGKQAVIEHGLRQSVRYLSGKLGKDPSKWAWGRLNKITFPHAFATQKPMDIVFNPPLRPMGGNAFTPCVSTSPPGRQWQEKDSVPSFRFAIDWSDPSKACCILPPGQSGNLASPHYMDMYDPWLKGEYIPLLWTREQIEANAEANLVLSSK
nr:penicillin acylase family protein [Candidatus Sigynarchaeota archaeon]